MPGARPSIKPLSAGRSSGLSGSSGSESFDEVAQLELHLQRQLEEDVARYPSNFIIILPFVYNHH